MDTNEEIIYDADYYIEQVDHRVPVLHYHLAHYTILIGGDWDEGDYEVMEQRIDGRTSPRYPGVSVIEEVQKGSIDPLEQGMLPYIRGWQWALWLIPSGWFGRLPMKYEMLTITGRRVTRARLERARLHSIFGMAPVGVLVGAGSERFYETRLLHDQIVDVFHESKTAEECTVTIYDKGLSGEWYFPDTMVIIEDMHNHVKLHRALMEEENE